MKSRPLGTFGSFLRQICGTYILCMALFPGNCQTYNRFKEYTIEIQDHVCTGDDVIATNETGIDIQCISMCVRNPLCLGSFHHAGDSACVQCNTWYNDTTDLISYSGMKYYRQTGEWNDWTSWSSCPYTCGGGTRTRTRTCTTPLCLHGNNQETQGCHNFSCTPYAPDCQGWADRGLTVSCTADIDPDGTGIQFGNLSVECDFDSEPGTVFTVVHHDQETRTFVDGFEDCGSYSAVLNYTIGLDAAIAIADMSAECKQYVKYECKHAEIAGCTFWRNRNQTQSTYITGPHRPSSVCDCGATGTCYSSDIECNCDSNINEWLYDDGFVMNKYDLPIYSFHAADTGSWWEEGYHTLGPMICWDN